MVNPSTDTDPLQHPFFTKGAPVEVSSDDEGFRGAWYSATILEIPPKSASKKRKKALVKYKTLLADVGSSPLTEHVDPAYIRPLPPNDKGTAHLDVNDVVNASYRDALRFHWSWIDGKWVRPEKQVSEKVNFRGSIFSSGTTVEVNIDNENIGNIWYPALVIKENEDNTFLVKYQNSMNGDEPGTVKVVDSLHIRPASPRYADRNYELLERVDATYNIGWRSRVITKVLTGRRYNVFFKHGNEDKGFYHSDIRPKVEWTDGKWVSKSKEVIIASDEQEQIGIALCDTRKIKVDGELDSSLPSKGNTEDKTPLTKMNKNAVEKSTSTDENNALKTSKKKVKLETSNGNTSHPRPSKKLTEGNAVETPVSVTGNKLKDMPSETLCKEDTPRTGGKGAKFSKKTVIDDDSCAKIESPTTGATTQTASNDDCLFCQHHHFNWTTKRQKAGSVDSTANNLVKRNVRARKSPSKGPQGTAAGKDGATRIAEETNEGTIKTKEVEMPIVIGLTAITKTLQAENSLQIPSEEPQKLMGDQKNNMEQWCNLMSTISLVSLSTESSDGLIWKDSGDGMFTVSSCVKKCVIGSEEVQFWMKVVWRGLLPPRVETLLWQIVQQKLVVETELARRGIQGIDDVLCPLCKKVDESSSHLFFSCSVVWALWNKFLQLWTFSSVLHEDTKTFLLGWEELKPNSAIWSFIPGVVIWTIWKTINFIVFEGEKLDQIELFFLARVRLASWFLAKYKDISIPKDSLISDPSIGDSHSSYKFLKSSIFPWCPPPIGFIKLNVDAATSSDWKKSGLGGILRDHLGAILGTFQESEGPSPPTLKELKAIQRGLVFVSSIQGREKFCLIVESDSRVAVDWIIKADSCPAVYAFIVKDIVGTKEHKVGASNQKRKRGRPSRSVVTSTKAFDAGKEQNGAGGITDENAVTDCASGDACLSKCKGVDLSAAENSRGRTSDNYKTKEVHMAAPGIFEMIDEDRPLSTWIGGMHTLGDEESRLHPTRLVNGWNGEKGLVDVPIESLTTDANDKSPLINDQSLPFVKRSPVWRTIDSMDIFRIVPQKPHFLPLAENREEFREGSAIATKGERKAEREIVESTKEISKFDEEMEEIEKKITQLQEQHESIKSEKETKNLKVGNLKLHVIVLNKLIQNASDEFKKIATASWKLP
ncbi:NFU domain protein 1 [Hibiscus syriacus]|uniref:NFU domain protein 1 n=1 Tax=Hibiscus syriacus TaxID=106335 RepID=A0A6A2YAJ9_HIBSY|nr:NFU domain protein 1 [Hibiscus syriacus]